jgi:hypothetical protein
MNTDIRFLALLEDDLQAAARREAESAQAPVRASSPRRLPRRGRSWGAIAAALVALLLVAGGIGFLVQGPLSPPAAEPARAAGDAQSILGVSNALGGAARNAKAPAPVAFAPDAPPNTHALHESAGTGVGSAAGVAQPQADLSKIERDGRIGVQVPHGAFSTNVATVTRIAITNGGMVLSSSTQNDDEGSFTLRIPAKHFDRAMLQLRALAAAPSRILYQDITGKDVTAQFVDLQARLSIAQGTKARLVGLQQKATSPAQILYLGGQIDQVQLQIEQLQGQIHYLNNQVGESTIQVEVQEKGAAVRHPTATVSQPSLTSALRHALQGLLRVIGAVIVGLGYLIPLMLLGLGVWALITVARRRSRATSSAL